MENFVSKPASEVGGFGKKIEIRRGTAEPNFNSFLQNPQPPKQALEAKISKVRHLRAVFTVNTPTLHSRVQSYSDNIHIFPFIATDIPVQFSPFHEIQVEKPEDDD